MPNDLSKTLTDIADCDREELQFLGAVQAHGCLLTFAAGEMRVCNASLSAEKFFLVPHMEIVGSRLDHLCAPELVQQVVAAIAEFPWGGARGRHLQYKAQLPTAALDAYLFRCGDLYALELETVETKGSVANEYRLKEFMIQSRGVNSVEGLGQLACRNIRQLTGMDRVMLYKFSPPSMHGSVLAEDKVAEAHSYLGHRFPSSDIPKNARDLYLRNQVRLIPNVDAEMSSIEPRLDPFRGQVIDLADSRLRAVAPIHLEYLRNMKVRASFSVAITLDEKLWGLFACHHMLPHFVTQSLRTTCEVIAQIFAVHVGSLESAHAREDRLRFDRGLRQLLGELITADEPLGQLFATPGRLESLFGVSGVAMVTKSTADSAGLTPPRAELHVMSEALRQILRNEERPFVAVQSLSEINSQWTEWQALACGLLAIPLPQIEDGLLLFFRPESIKTVTWGGDPRKQLEKRGFQGRVNPRVSFASWHEMITGQSHEWRDFEIEGALFLRDILAKAAAPRRALPTD